MEHIHTHKVLKEIHDCINIVWKKWKSLLVLHTCSHVSKSHDLLYDIGVGMGNHMYVFGVSYTYGIPTLLHTCLTVVLALGIGVHPYSQNFAGVCMSYICIHTYPEVEYSPQYSTKSPIKVVLRRWLLLGWNVELESAASCHGDHGVLMCSSCKAIYGGRLQ